MCRVITLYDRNVKDKRECSMVMIKIKHQIIKVISKDLLSRVVGIASETRSAYPSGARCLTSLVKVHFYLICQLFKFLLLGLEFNHGARFCLILSLKILLTITSHFKNTGKFNFIKHMSFLQGVKSIV